MARLLSALLVLLLTSTACTSGSPRTPTATAEPPFRTYVALGDSFSAGPLIPTSDLAGGCLRSDHNYPSLVAERLRVDTFVDVTCSGAQTADLVRPQRPFEDSRIPPQLRAVTADTDLVTIGIGGNDLDLFGTLVDTCTRLRASDPTGAPCTRALARTGANCAATTRTIRDRVTAALRAIRHRAPHATVVLVGYLRLAPDRGTCPELPLATGDYAQGRRVSRMLDRALAQAARRAGVEFVDMYTASRGHDICSDHPWVNGSVTDRARALAYHPFAVGMRADADAVVRLLQRTS
jgi:lysophospholipase L1-like esterase